MLLWGSTFGDVPEQVVVYTSEESMVLYEHSFSASTFAARVVTSTQSYIYSAVTAAIRTLKGPCTEAPTKRTWTT